MSTFFSFRAFHDMMKFARDGSILFCGMSCPTATMYLELTRTTIQMIMGILVTRSPGCTLAASAFAEMNQVLSLFEEGATRSRRAHNALVSLLKPEFLFHSLVVHRPSSADCETELHRCTLNSAKTRPSRAVLRHVAFATIAWRYSRDTPRCCSARSR